MAPRPGRRAIQPGPYHRLTRSGTTLLEQMLDAHPDYQSMDEQPFIHEPSVRMAAADQAYPEALGDMMAEDIRKLQAVYWSVAAPGSTAGSDWWTSYAQVTEGIYQRGIGRWKACRELFEPVLEELAPLIERLGYSF